MLTNYYKSLGFYDVNNSNLAQINEKSGLVDISYNISEEADIIWKNFINVDDVFDKKLFSFKQILVSTLEITIHL